MTYASTRAALAFALGAGACGSEALRPLNADAHTFRPLGAAADRFVVSPSRDDHLALLWGLRVFERQGPRRWAEVDARVVSGWSDAEVEAVRLATGQTVQAAVLPGGLRVAATPAGMVEGTSLRGALEPVGLPLPVRAGAVNPKQPSQVLLAGDPAGLYVCGPAAQCEFVEPSRFEVVRWFDDGTWLLGDDVGGVWRHDEDGFRRTSLGKGPVVDLDGVPDGGPRVVILSSGKVFRSEDHGRTWEPAEALAGRLGPGGLLAAVDGAGTLVLGRLDTPMAPVGFEGTLARDSRLIWASPQALLAMQPAAVDVIEPRRNLARRYALGDGERVLDARMVNDTIEILVAGPVSGAISRRVSGQASLTDRAVSGGISGGWPWFVVLFGVLGLLGLVVTRGPFRKGRDRR